MAGGSKLYSYVNDTNTLVDIYGLECSKAIVRQFENGHPEGHFTIEIIDGSNSLHTHQVITSRDHSTTTIIPATRRELDTPVHTATIELSDGAAAMDLQKSLLNEELGPYDVIQNSCLSHVADVVNAGGGSVDKTRLGYAKFLRRNGFGLLR